MKFRNVLKFGFHEWANTKEDYICNFSNLLMHYKYLVLYVIFNK